MVPSSFVFLHQPTYDECGRRMNGGVKMSDTFTRARVLVHGHVQGVAYRAFAQAAASKCGVRGGVRNLNDGSVEAEVEGDKQAVEAFLECLRTGPPRAKVEALDVEWQSPTGLPVDFRIWY
jgi:acylphosphatase